MRTFCSNAPLLATLALASFVLTSTICNAHFTDQWAVHIKDSASAEVVARDTNCIVEDAIFDDVHLIRCPHVSKRSVEAHHETHRTIASHPHVQWAEQQKVLSRKKRQLWGYPPQRQQQQQQQMYQPQFQQQQQQQSVAPHDNNFIDLVHLNDNRWPQMWYLNRGNRLDMNVQEAWLAGFTGKGVSVTILDDGIERSHPDLQANYDQNASYDVNQNDPDPTPRYDLIDSNRHGTRCAGEVAATANNSECAVGIAFDAGIGGVRMLDGDVTDAVEAKSLGYNNQHIDIYSASWGPDDDGKTVDGPGKLATRAFLQGIASGRSGKGSIFVWASGNGGRDYDNCNCDGYTNSIWTLSVSSATENGLIPWYSEACSSTLATTYSSGSSGEQKVVTTDLHHTCTSSHTGTSASAPLAAGIIALTLQANAGLNWRDVQHLTVRCAHTANLRATDWAVNGLGRNYSHSFGYGLMDASCMVHLAQKWKTVPEQKKCLRSAEKINLIIPGKNRNKATLEVKDCDQVKYLEHVQAHVTLAATKRGDVQISLTSPSGTKSLLIDKRPKDYSRAGFNDWPFLTVHMWEESPIGLWTLEVLNDGRSIVELKEWSIAFLGTETPPQPIIQEKIDVPVKVTPAPPPPPPAAPKEVLPQPTPPPPGPPAIDLNNVQPSPPEQATGDVSGGSLPQGPDKSNPMENCLEQSGVDWCNICDKPYVQLNGRCVESCPNEGYYKGQSNRHDVCVPCYYSCKTCSGSNDYECLSCFGDAELEEESSTQRYCHNKSLINRVFSSSRWYYVLSIGFMVNFGVVVVLVVYIMRWRKRHRPLIGSSAVENGVNGGGGVAAAATNGVRKASILLSRTAINNSSRYAPVQLTDELKAAGTIPFHDYDTSSDDEQLFRKPYSDEIK